MNGHLMESIWQAGQGGGRSLGWKDQQTSFCPNTGLSIPSPPAPPKPVRCVLHTKALQEGLQDAPQGFEVFEALSLQRLMSLPLGGGALSSP